MDSHPAVTIVTGSSGLLGSAMVRCFAEKFQVVGFDRAGYPHPPPEAECVCVDLIHGEPWGTRRFPKSLAKAGAWVQDVLPLGGKPFIKAWMIDLADDHYALDISRARELLEWEPQHSLRAMLPPMVTALKASPDGWYRENRLSPPRRLGRTGSEKENR